MESRVHHHEAAARFELPLGEHLALCSYRLVDGVLVLHHTEVPPALQGQGVAAELVAATLAWAGARGLQVRPTCSYVAAYMRRHPETHGLLEPPPGRQ